uniref:diacylglycerol O-acyltransferase n=1 Tax=Haptolina ericina TaxID=156174 RepID=A0A7S3FFM5_9EUKA
MDYTTNCPSYFGEFEVHNAHGVDADAQYFCACHPHGTVIFQRTFWRSQQLAQHLRRDFRMIAASVLFRIPIVREMTLWFGAVDAGRSNCERMLRAGVNVVVWPGGLDEANSVDGLDAVRIRARSGFVRLAVKHGVDVLPIFVFGELDAVRAVSPLPRALADYLKRKFRISTSIFMGRWGTFVPRRVPFHLCIGRPCRVTQRSPDHPDYAEEVKRVHAAYVMEIKAIYESYRERFGYGARELIFVDDGAKKKA